jgi:hypothetical protein
MIMMSTRTILQLGTTLSLALAVACERSAERITGAAGDRPSVAVRSQSSLTANVLLVADVEELYAAVNDPTKEGAAITLAPGTYLLSAIGPGNVARPNGGRLELQEDMSLSGTTDDRSAVVIDASALPTSSFNAPFGRTAPLRIGRGSNTIEWLTVKGNPQAAGSIATELPGIERTRIRVAHVNAEGSSRGLDVRNASAANAGRRIDVEIVDNEFIGPARVVGMSEGIRLVNFVDVDGGVIVGTLSGNRVHGFQIGCIIANNRSSDAVVRVRSADDRFFGNAMGCVIAGGLGQGTIGRADRNSTTFEADGSAFVDNKFAIAGFAPGGLLVLGARSIANANVASDNTVSVALWRTQVSGNGGVNFQVFGALQDAGLGVAGTNNRAIIKLHDVHKEIVVTLTASLPADPTGSNTAIVHPSNTEIVYP